MCISLSLSLSHGISFFLCVYLFLSLSLLSKIWATSHDVLGLPPVDTNCIKWWSGDQVMPGVETWWLLHGDIFTKLEISFPREPLNPQSPPTLSRDNCICSARILLAVLSVAGCTPICTLYPSLSLSSSLPLVLLETIIPRSDLPACNCLRLWFGRKPGAQTEIPEMGLKHRSCIKIRGCWYEENLFSLHLTLERGTMCLFWKGEVWFVALRTWQVAALE